MLKKYFKIYSKKDAEEAEEFVNTLSSKNTPGMLNSFGNFRKYMEFYVSRNDQYGFNKMVEGYFKAMKSDATDNMDGIIRYTLKGLCRTIDKENLVQNKIIGTSAINMLNKYNKRVGINVRYNVNGYSPKEVYERLEGFSDGFALTHPNLIKLLEKKWNKKRNLMSFRSESRGNTIKGDIQIKGGQLIVNSYVPSEAKPYVNHIVNKVKNTLEDIFPKAESDLELSVSE